MGNKWEQLLEQFRDVEPFLVENSDLSNTTQLLTLKMELAAIVDVGVHVQTRNIISAYMLKHCQTHYLQGQGRRSGVQPHQTSSNLCDEGGRKSTGEVRSSNTLIKPTGQPPRAYSNLTCGLYVCGLRIFGGLNHPELSRTFPVNMLIPSLHWFEEVL